MAVLPYNFNYEGAEMQALFEKIDDLGPASQEDAGTMSSADKTKLDGIDSGAEANVLEGIKIDNVLQTIVDKVINLQTDNAPASGSANLIKSGAIYLALANYYLKTETYSKAEVNALVAAIKQFTYQVVAELPTASADTMYIVYLIPSTNPKTKNAKDEFITVQSGSEGSYTYSWEQIGTTTIDISGKADKVSGATNNHLAGLDGSGNLKDSGIAGSDVMKTSVMQYDTEGESFFNMVGFNDAANDQLFALPDTDNAENVDDARIIATRGREFTEGDLAEFDEAGNIVDSGRKPGDFVKVGDFTLADGLVDTQSNGTPQEFIFRQSGGDGVNYMKLIKGKSLVWNQLVNLSSTPYSATNASYSNGVFRATAKNGVVLWRTGVETIVGHKYYAAMTIKTTADAGKVKFMGFGDHINIANIASSSVQRVSQIKTAQESNNFYRLIDTRESDWDDVNVYGCLIIDLTLMFGEGKEPSTVAEFEALYPELYYPYTATPAIINNDAVALETTGFNQWDEEYKKGTYSQSDGETFTPNDAVIASKNKIMVLPGETYYLKVDAVPRIFFYDVNGNFKTSILGAANSTITIPADVYFVRFQAAYSDSYNHDICINISDASRNGTYEPYKLHTVTFPTNPLRVDDDGTVVEKTDWGKSAGSAFNYINPNTKKYGEVLVKVNLGDLNWSLVPAEYRVVGSLPSGIYKTFAISAVANIICDRYIAASVSSILNQSAQGYIGKTNNISINDSALYNLSSGEAVKAALNGIYVYLELATPIEYDLVDDIPNAIIVDESGTEKAVYPVHQDGTPSAPFRSDSNYSISIANLVRKLNSNA